MDFYSIYKLVLRKIWYILLIPISCTILSFYLTGKLAEKFKSTVQLATGFTTQSDIKITDERFNFREALTKFNNMVETMNSEVILSSVSYKLLLHDIDSDKPFRITSDTLNKIEYTSINIPKIVGEKVRSRSVLSRVNEKEMVIINLLKEHGYLSWQLKEDLLIRRIADTDYVSIEFTSEDPYLSSFVVNSIADHYIDYDTYLKSDLSGKAVSFFQDQVDQKGKLVNIKIDEIKGFKSVNSVNSEGSNAVLVAKLSEYEFLRDVERKNIFQYQLTVAQLKNDLSALGNVSNDEVNKKVVQLRSRITELNRVYIDGDSKDKDLAKTISVLKEQLSTEIRLLNDQESRSIKDELEQKLKQNKLQLAVAQSNLISLNNSISRLESNSHDFFKRKSKLDALENELENLTTDYASSLEKLDLESNKLLLATSSVKVLIRGQPKLEPESKKRLLLIALSFIASLAITLITIFGFYFVDFRITTQSQFERTIPIELIGSLNKVNLKKLDFANIFKSEANKENEAFKQLLRKLRLAIRNSNQQTLMVTSLKQQEGKTFVLYSLAYSLSLLKKNILIIDTNFKNNSLTRILAPNKQFQLIAQESDQLLLSTPDSEPRPEDDQKNNPGSFISKTKHKRIDIIGNNGRLDSPSEIFADKDFNIMLDNLKNKYDYVLIEGPAVNDFSDSMELVNFVDKVLLVFSSGAIIKQTDRTSMSTLQNLNGKLIGAVLNKIEFKDLEV